MMRRKSALPYPDFPAWARAFDYSCYSENIVITAACYAGEPAPAFLRLSFHRPSTGAWAFLPLLISFLHSHAIRTQSRELWSSFSEDPTPCTMMRDVRGKYFPLSAQGEYRPEDITLFFPLVRNRSILSSLPNEENENSSMGG